MKIDLCINIRKKCYQYRKVVNGCKSKDKTMEKKRTDNGQQNTTQKKVNSCALEW